jgi:hypothetical protein
VCVYILLNYQQELLSKLHHYNSAMRKSSVEGLQQLVMHHSDDTLGVHLAALVEGTARLVLDEEKDVRKSALKLLSFILTQVKHFGNFNVARIYRHIAAA